MKRISPHHPATEAGPSYPPADHQITRALRIIAVNDAATYARMMISAPWNLSGDYQSAVGWYIDAQTSDKDERAGAYVDTLFGALGVTVTRAESGKRPSVWVNHYLIADAGHAAGVPAGYLLAAVIVHEFCHVTDNGNHGEPPAYAAQETFTRLLPARYQPALMAVLANGREKERERGRNACAYTLQGQADEQAGQPYTLVGAIPENGHAELAGLDEHIVTALERQARDDAARDIWAADMARTAQREAETWRAGEDGDTGEPWQVIAEGVPWRDSDGRTQWPYREACALQLHLSGMEYRDVHLVRVATGVAS